MTDIQAAVGIKQLEKLDVIVEERRKIASFYSNALKNIGCIRLPIEKEAYFSNYQSYSIYLKKSCPISRNDLIQKLLDEGISTRRGVMTAHHEIAYKDICEGLHLPISEDISDNSIIIPLYVPMSSETLDFVAKRLLSFLLSIS
jgi:perosamine synthetase